ncbi:peritrophin-1-like [Nasonia vitripennis]|uniref:Chitin-binding type-2 domain-containing protein n=1 Tax=Nasonia vitripennis TaxID=7425 RepID=A0A7M7GFA7_NASVI|nr:peritrophin-1-like [Nasonia vitripennis]
MKVLVALTIFGFAALAYAAVVPADIEYMEVETLAKPKCPPSPAGKIIVLPNPSNCTTYYQCSGGFAWEMPCPTGLHWNAKAKTCDWPEGACCDPAYDPEGKCKKY